MEFVRLGFVGCGTHSTNNLYPMLKYARCRLVAVCDLNRELAERNARMFGAESVYTNVDVMLAEQKLDGVMVVGPDVVHYEVAKKALARGLPVFVEKPPADSLEKTREMVKLAQKHQTLLMTGFMKRHGLKHGRRFTDDGGDRNAGGASQCHD